MDDKLHENVEEQKNKKKPKRSGNVTGWILILLGVLFLLNNYYILDFEKFWPLILVGIGIILLVRRSS
ncbi:MAG: hypothetical protein JSV84_06670 [Gemmatimonadota bacterium]|nr:MAG: hypothetical protein JSV84_06670 [Gemmatimonadota bacterium]